MFSKSIFVAVGCAASLVAATLVGPAGAIESPDTAVGGGVLGNSATQVVAGADESERVQGERSPNVEGSGGLTDEEVELLQQQGREQLEADPAARAEMFSRSHCQSVPFNPHQVCGAIRGRYNQLGGLASWLLWPVGPELLNPDGLGYRQQFRNGFIYWHPDTGAHAVSVRTEN